MAETGVLLKTVSEIEVAPNQWLVNGWLVNFLLREELIEVLDETGIGRVQWRCTLAVIASERDVLVLVSSAVEEHWPFIVCNVWLP